MEELAQTNLRLVRELHSLRQSIGTSAAAAGEATAGDRSSAQVDVTGTQQAGQGLAQPSGASGDRSLAQVCAAETQEAVSAGLSRQMAEASAKTQAQSHQRADTAVVSSARTEADSGASSGSQPRRRLVQAGTFPSVNENVAHYKRQHVDPRTRLLLDARNAKTKRRRERK